MEFQFGGPVLKLLLLVEGDSAQNGVPDHRELDERTAINKSLKTLSSAVPSASMIHVCVQDERQKEFIRESFHGVISGDGQRIDGDSHQHPFPTLEMILVHQNDGAALLAAHEVSPESKWLVLNCAYSSLPPPALQQLILEYQEPVTCFVDQSGSPIPSIGIWGVDALKELKGSVPDDQSELNSVIKLMGGKLVQPLREEWIQRPGPTMLP